MIDMISSFNDLLKKYRLVFPVPMDLQEKIILYRKKDLKAILRKKDSYTNIFWFVIITNLSFRKLGIKLTMLQSKIIAGITASALLTGSSISTYHTARYIVKKINDDKPVRQELKLKPEIPINNTDQSGVDDRATRKNKNINQEKLNDINTEKKGDVEGKSTLEKASTEEDNADDIDPGKEIPVDNKNTSKEKGDDENYDFVPGF